MTNREKLKELREEAVFAYDRSLFAQIEFSIDKKNPALGTQYERTKDLLEISARKFSHLCETVKSFGSIDEEYDGI